MKKIVITIAIVLGVVISAFSQSQWGGGLFQYGEVSNEDYYGSVWFALDQNKEIQQLNGLLPGLPGHGENINQNAPLGGGAMLLFGLGVAYALKKRNRKK